MSIEGQKIIHTQNEIPKIIHFCWFGKKALPKSVKKCIKSWKEKCPDYKIVRWDETNFDIHCNKFVEDAYKNKAWAFVSDYARLKIIYENGGFYLDTDVELLKSLDGLRNQQCYLAIQQNGKNIATGLGFGSVKNHKVVKKILDIYDTVSFDNNKREDLACPILTDLALKDITFDRNTDSIVDIPKHSLTIFPSEYFDPLSPGDTKDLLSEKTYSIHHYDATWTGKKNRTKRYIINKIGQKRVKQIKRILGREK